MWLDRAISVLVKVNSLFKIETYFLRYGRKLSIGKKLRVMKGFRLFAYGKLTIGDGCFFNEYCSVNCMDEITIGDNCLFGKNVNIYDHNHDFRSAGLVKLAGYRTGRVIIGNNVWIASNVTILEGVTIGNNAVVGAGCVVYKDIPDDTMVINKQDQSLIKYKQRD